MAKIGERIKRRRIELQLTQQELADRMGYKSKSTINKVESGINDVNQTTAKKYAVALNTNVAYLMGWTTDARPDIDDSPVTQAMYRTNEDPKNPNAFTKNWIEASGYNIGDVLSKSQDISTDIVAVPIYGRVAAGNGVCAYEDISGYVTVSKSLASTGDIFALRIVGDSMEPKISDNDVVIVRKQSDADNGDTIIALINGDDAVCKRLRKYDGGIMLLSNNPKYEPRVFTKQDTDDIPVRIIGRVMELRSQF